jgi:hypothetical protein
MQLLTVPLGRIISYNLLLGRWSVSLIQWVYHALESCVAWAWAPALSSFRRSPGPLGSLYRLLRAYGIVGIRRVHVGLGAWCFFLHFLRPHRALAGDTVSYAVLRVSNSFI